MVDRSEEMDVFKKDEKDLSATFVNLTSAWIAEPNVAQAMAYTLGIEIPKEAQTILDAYAIQAKKDKEEAKRQFDEGQKDKLGNDKVDPKTELRPKRDEDAKAVETVADEIIVYDDSNLEKLYSNPKADLDIDRWRRKALKNIGKPFEFITDNIDEDTKTAIHEALQTCKDADEVKAVFESHVGTSSVTQTDLSIISETQEPVKEPDSDTLLLETAIKALQTNYNETQDWSVDRKLEKGLNDYYKATLEEGWLKKTEGLLQKAVNDMQVTVNVPEQPPAQITVNVPPAQINIPPAQVNVQPAQVNVTVPEQKAPVVNVHMPKVKNTRQTVNRNREGEITSTDTKLEY